ncbi:hypothetical protein [Streptomyces sp. NPDC059979]|uniref:hypothetical protein n=1 Tax=Streptomyces sp. NPDC059979 TaxID=3347021 RepID=UPI0036A75BD0
MIPAKHRMKGGALLLGARRPGEAGPFGTYNDGDQGDEETPVPEAASEEGPPVACPACEAGPPAADPVARHRRYRAAVSAAIEQRQRIRYETGVLRRAAVGPLYAARRALLACVAGAERGDEDDVPQEAVPARPA